MAGGLSRLIWLPIAAVALGVVWLVWIDGQRQPSGRLFGLPDAATEAGYCLAVAERGPPTLEAFLTESIDFWRLRVGASAVAGRAALGADLAKPGVQEQAHLHLALQDCGQRAVGLYGYRFAALGPG